MSPFTYTPLWLFHVKYSDYMLFVSVQRICSEFENIREKALKVPQTIDDIAKMTDYIHITKTEGVAELNEKIKVNILLTVSIKCGELHPSEFEHLATLLSLDRTRTVDWSTSWMSTLLTRRIWNSAQLSFHGLSMSSTCLTSVTR